MPKPTIMPAGPADKARPYAYFALAVLTASSILNYLDRLILSILAQSIKIDLKLDDAQLGFLLGTGFAVFYSVVGIAMGRIADNVSRTRLMASGLAIWSAMTALGAAATNFAGLAAARIGVGIGEATANPASHSLIADYFPPRNRGAALGTYVAGAFLGGAAAMILGGYILQHWNSGLCSAMPGRFACGLKGWQAALILVGLPGIPLTVLVSMLREPQRPPVEPISLSRLMAREFGAAIPPFTLISLYRSGSRMAFRSNLVLIAALVVNAGALILLTGDKAQWAAIALGAYSVITWGQAQKLKDRPFYRLTFGCPTFVISMLGAALTATTLGAVSAWAAPYAIRTLGMSPVDAGLTLGITMVGTSCMGVIVGGWLGDKWKLRDRRAPIWITCISLVLSLPALAVMLTAETPGAYLVGYGLFALCSSGWAGAFAAMVQDLVLPRMRGGAASAFTLVNIIISAGAGPYWVGKVSSLTGSLATGMISIQVLAPFALLLLFIASRRILSEDGAGRQARAEEAGEAVASPLRPVLA